MRLTCYYCGAEISTDEGQIGALIVCPGCGHRVRVPRPGRSEASPPQADRRSSAVRKDAAAWEHVSNQEIRDTVLYEALPRAEKLRVNLKRAFAFVLPRYDDLTLFAFGIAFVLLALLDPGLRGALAAIGTDPHTETETLLLGFAGLGLTLSLIGVVWPRDKSEFEKVMMLFFAILITIGAGVSTWRTPGAGALGWLAVFPLWNQFNAVLLFRATAGDGVERATPGKRPADARTGAFPDGKFGRLLKSFRFQRRLTRITATGQALPRRRRRCPFRSRQRQGACRRQGRMQRSLQPFFWRLIA